MKLKFERCVAMNNSSGLKLKAEVEKIDENVLHGLWKGVAVGLLLCGWFLFFSDSLESIKVKALVAVFAFVLPILFFTFSKFPKCSFVFLTAVGASVLLMPAFLPVKIANGAICVYNDLLDSLGKASGKIMPLLEQIKTSTSGDTAAFLIFFLLLAFLIITLSEKSRFTFLYVPISAAVIGFECLTGSVNKIALVLTVLGVSILFLSKQTRAPRNMKSLIYRVGAAVCCACVLLCSVAFNGNLSFWNKAEKLLSNAAERVKYSGESILPEGDFSKIQNFEPSNNEKLEVVMNVPESYYLRGYVGEVYNGNGWEALDTEKLYSYSDLFYWLHRCDFYGQTQLAKVANLTEQTESENRILIKNLGASSKYIYSPYETLTADNEAFEDSIGDKSFENGKNNSSYSLSASLNSVKKYTYIAAELYEAEKSDDEKFSEYLNCEAHYNSFVYENYLEIPQETRNLFETLLGKYEIEDVHADYGKAKQSILSFLTSEMEYSESAEPVECDFLDYFLQQSGSGYSVHFATAAAMMFRYYGIPSRYVEGYLITPDDVEGVISNSAIRIDETHAHAWAEFYQDGVGWIPFEVTPVYLDVMEKADDLKAVGLPEKETSSIDKSDEADSKKQTQGTKDLREQKTKKNVLAAALTAAGSMLLMIFAAIAVIACINRKKLAKLKALFNSGDCRKAVIGIFGYGASFENAKGESDTEIYFSQKDTLFENAFEIYEKARFSKHEITSDDKSEVEKFSERAVADYKNSRSALQRFLDMHFRFLY